MNDSMLLLPWGRGTKKSKRSPGKLHLSRMVTAKNSAGSVAVRTPVGRLQQKRALRVSQADRTLVSPRFPGKEQMLGPWEEEGGMGRRARPEDQGPTAHACPRSLRHCESDTTQCVHAPNTGQAKGEMPTAAQTPTQRQFRPAFGERPYRHPALFRASAEMGNWVVR